MKRNTLKTLMLSTLVASLLAGCNDKPSDSISEVKPSTPTSEAISPSENASEESSSVTSSDESSASQESSTPVVEDKINARVSLPRRIYLRSELNERLAENKPAIEIETFEAWSNALKNYKELSNATYSIVIPEGTGNLQCKAIVSAAQKYVASFGIEVYNTLEEALEAHKDVEESEFKESIYYKSGKMTADTYHVVNEDNTYSYYYNSVKQPVTYIDNSDSLRTFTNYSWATKVAYVFTSTEKNTNTAVLDPSRKTAPHHPLNDQSRTIEKVGSALVENVSAIDYSKTFNLDNRTIAWSDYGIDISQGAGGFANYSSEMIIDADGNICYLALLAKSDTYIHVPLVQNENGTTEWYCSPKYQENDYSTVEGAKANTNPAFLFADDYDPTDPEKMYHFEKVIPEGGYHIININNFGGSSEETGFSTIDNIWAAASGTGRNIYSSQMDLDQAVSFENETLNSARVFYRNGKFNGLTFQKQLSLYIPADTYRTYAYLKYKSGTDATKLEYATIVQDALKAQKSKITVYGSYEQLEEEKKGPLSISYYEEHGTAKLVSMSSEPVLYNYYTEQSNSKLSEWEKIVLG